MQLFAVAGLIATMQVIGSPPSGSITIDSGDVEAIPLDLWPRLDLGMKRVEVPRIPSWAHSVNYDARMSGRAALDLMNTSDHPIWFEGSLTMRMDRWHDPDAWWDYFPRNSGSQFIVPQSNPIPPGGTRTIYLDWDETVYWIQENPTVVDRWKDKYDYQLFDCYYPVIISVCGQSVNPDIPAEAHALGAWASVGGEYENGIHKYPPRGRVRITARYGP
jgi:hypothetical protein